MDVIRAPEYLLLVNPNSLSNRPETNEHKLCRLCAKSTSGTLLVPIFEDITDNQLANTVNKYLPIKISKYDQLPKNICKTCVSTLTEWDNLFITSIEADKKLRLMCKNAGSTTLRNDIKHEVCDEEEIIKNEYSESELCNDPSLELELVKVSDDCDNYCDGSNELDCRPTVDKTLITNSDEFLLESKFTNERMHIVNCYSSSGLEKVGEDISHEVTSNYGEETQGSTNEHGITKLKSLEGLVKKNGSNKTKQKELKKRKHAKRRKIPCTCPVCQKSFSCKEYLIAHSVVHSSIRPYKCGVCDATFKRQSHLLGHQKVVHEGKRRIKKSRNIIDSELKAEVGEFTCNNCTSGFTNKYDLLKHIKKSHVKLFCDVCDKTFSSESSLYKHHFRHQGISCVCDICGKVFADKFLLNAHLKLHSEEKSFMCEVCGKCFRLKFYLEGHMFMHTDLRPHSCPHCPKKFHRPSHLTTHIRTHTGEKPYACHICNRAFAQSGDRNKHILTHKLIKE